MVSRARRSFGVGALLRNMVSSPGGDRLMRGTELHKEKVPMAEALKDADHERRQTISRLYAP